MIDYEKLKLAQDLAERLPEIYLITIRLSGHLFPACDFKLEYKFDSEKGGLYTIAEYLTLDSLIIKLNELNTTPLAKYSIGQEVWHLNDEYLPESFTIDGFDYTSDHEEYIYHEYEHSGEAWLKSQLYPTKESLIEAQIEYWKLQRLCQHENDGLIYRIERKKITYAENRCKKCGEFYV